MVYKLSGLKTEIKLWNGSEGRMNKIIPSQTLWTGYFDLVFFFAFGTQFEQSYEIQ